VPMEQQKIGKHTIVCGKPVTGVRRRRRKAKDKALEFERRLTMMRQHAEWDANRERVKATGGRNQRIYTRGVFAWRVQNGTASRVESTFLVDVPEEEFYKLVKGGGTPEELLRTATYVARGGRSAYDIVPRMRTSRLSEWAIFTMQADGKGRPQLIRAGFKVNCVNGRCKTTESTFSRNRSCASCWLTENTDSVRVQKGKVFLIKEQNTFDREQVDDATGVEPSGKKFRGGNACLREDAPHFSITSTIKDYKSGSNTNEQLDPHNKGQFRFPTNPKTKDFRDDIDVSR